MTNKGLSNPVILFSSYEHDDSEQEDFQIEASADTSAVLFDGLCDGLYLSNDVEKGQHALPDTLVTRTAFAIL